ncbi:hypothetical protein AMECASPLE_013791 [Ameca splendens]|uniref:Uncharacterized protein n=1 Tax=Ameca splendens TaxID=208324 RepID=A0ABV0XEM5_9TELE
MATKIAPKCETMATLGGGHHQWKKSEILLSCWYMMMHDSSAGLDCPGQSSWSSAWSWPQCYRGEPGGTVGLWYHLQFSLPCGPFNRSFSEETDLQVGYLTVIPELGHASNMGRPHPDVAQI